MEAKLVVWLDFNDRLVDCLAVFLIDRINWINRINMDQVSLAYMIFFESILEDSQPRPSIVLYARVVKGEVFCLFSFAREISSKLHTMQCLCIALHTSPCEGSTKAVKEL